MRRYEVPATTVTEYDPGLWAMSGDRLSPNGAWHLTLRRPVTLRDTPTFSKTFHYSNFFDWIGKLREISMRPAYHSWVSDLASGAWGMVTNNSELRVIATADPEDVVEGSLWLDKLSGKHRSTMEMRFDWFALRPDGRRDRIAAAAMKATWVAITGHGTVDIRPFPAYFTDIAEAMMPPASAPVPAGAPVSYEPDRGAFGALFGELRAPPSYHSKAGIHEHVYATSSVDSNLVGNIYFANYYLWQAKTVDFWVHSVAPTYARTPIGELRCVRTRIDHLREAMPFDRVLTRLSMGDVYERGVRLYTEFYRSRAEGAPEKLGFGEYEALWTEPGPTGWRPAALPAALREPLMRAIRAGSAP
jgi:acyl-CoA thioesterase FadM